MLHFPFIMLNRIDLTGNFNHHQIKEVDIDFMDHSRVRNFTEALLYFGHELLSINLRAVSTTGLQRKFRHLDWSYFVKF